MVLAEAASERPAELGTGIRSMVYWPGAKAKFRAQLVQHLASVPHERYVEPFCGAAWVLLTKRRVANEWLNDADGELINFFRQLADPPARRDLEARLQFVGLHSRQILDELAAADPAPLAPVERALRFLLVNRIGGGRGAWQERLSDAAPSRWDDVLRDGWQMANRLRAVHIEHGDGVALVAHLDVPGTLYFLDPPYLDDRRGRVSAPPALHARLADALAGLRGHFLLTHPWHPFWRDAAKAQGWDTAVLGREYGLDGTWRDVHLVANFPLTPDRQGTLFA